MDKRVVSVLVALLATVLWSQTVPEKWTVYTFVGTYSTPYPSGVETKIETEFGDLPTSGYIGNRYGMPFIRTAETDTLNESLIFPMIFDVPDKDEEGNFTGENIGIQEYLGKHGETDEYGFKSIPYLNFLEEAVPSFWRTMFKRTNDGTSVPNVSSEIEIRYIWVPGTTNDPWIINDEGSYGTRMNNLQNLIRNTLEPGEYDSYKNRSERKSVMLMLPEYPGTSGFGYVSYLGDLVVRVFWRPEVLNQTTNSIVHELGHSILYYDDQGSGKVAYDGKLTDVLKLGRTYNTTGIYDLMHRTGSSFSPHLLYGLLPFNTEDLMNTNGVLLKNKIIPENSNENKTITCLKAIREDLTDEELLDDNTFETISIPITPDPVFDGETNGNLVTNQKFLIEYRNGEGFDNYTAMYQDHISKGVLISHIIKSPYSSEYLSKRIIDIECAVPFPDGYRNPSESWPSNPTYNGEWYFGKKINDWMDDYAPLYRWPIEGGKSTWWRLQPPIKFQSLPTDFFNDTDRNKFTPVTRPNTNSWKGAETNIGVFVDKIEGDYAYLTIYRNYFSNPFTMGTKDPDKSNILEIKGDGYIGENFYVDDGLSLNIGEPDNPGKTTVIPNTNMSICNGAIVNIQNNSILRLENSNIDIVSGSYLMPYVSTSIELENSRITFEDVAFFESRYMENHNITLNSSSFTCKDMELKGLVNLSLNNFSKMNFYADTNLKFTGESNISIEEGSQLIFGAGSTVSIEGTSMLHGDIMTKNVALFELKENSTLNLCPSTDFNIVAGTTLKLGKNSKLVLENGSNLVLDDGAVVELEEGAEIVIMNKGTLSTKNLTSDRVTFTAPTGQWKGITCEVGSTVIIDGASISGAETAVLGTPFGCTIKNSSIYNCANAVELINCSNYLIENNVMTGNDSGFAVRLASSNGTVRDNTLKNFSYGLVIILCSPEITKNLIRDNVMNGIYINGNNAYPYLVDDLENDIIVNNQVVANGINTYDEKNAQIRMVYPSNAYMYYGMNNIYYHQNAPAIYAQSNLVVNDQMKSLTNPVVRISAQYNYWGASEITSENSSDIFDLWRTLYEGYSVTYTDYATKPFPDDGLPITTLYGDMTLEAKMLAQAIKAENDGRIDLAIKKYEKLIDKFPDSEENYIAVIRLTDILAEKEEPLDQLMALYDENIVSGDDTTNKRFYKEMKVAASIKSKKYDDAITLAEDLKAQAQTDNDVVLAELDIAIAKMMKTAENNNKGATIDFADITSLSDKVSGGNTGSQLTGITEGIIPKESKLYQNYPNPFNPVTQIRFDLAKTEEVKLSVYNVSGQLVSELVNGVVNAGCHSIEFDGSKLNSGVYYYTLSTKSKTATQKMILTK